MKEKPLSSSSGGRKLSCRLLRRRRWFFTQRIITSLNFCRQTLWLLMVYINSKIKTSNRANSQKKSPLRVIRYKTLVSGSGSPVAANWIPWGGFHAITVFPALAFFLWASLLWLLDSTLSWTGLWSLDLQGSYSCSSHVRRTVFHSGAHPSLQSYFLVYNITNSGLHFCKLCDTPVLPLHHSTNILHLPKLHI